MERGNGWEIYLSRSFEALSNAKYFVLLFLVLRSGQGTKSNQSLKLWHAIQWFNEGHTYKAGPGESLYIQPAREVFPRKYISARGEK